MSRNTALRGLAWLILLFACWATPFGDAFSSLLQWFTGEALTEVQLWCLGFVILTLLAGYMGKIFVGLWGEKEEQPKAKAWSSRTSMAGMYVCFTIVVAVGVVLLQVVR